MNKRKIFVTLAGVGILVLCILLSGFFEREPKEKPEASVLPTAVNATAVSPGPVSRFINITGRLVPKQRVTLYAEVNGVAKFGGKPFKEGNTFNQGEVLVSINSDEVTSALAAQRSNFQSQIASVIPDLKLDFPQAAPTWEGYLNNLDISKRLAPLPEMEDKKLKLFLSGRSLLTTYYNIREAETRLDKYIIRAPFRASVTDAMIDESTLVRTGQPIGTIISTGQYELEAGVSYLDAQALQIGTAFTLKDVNTGKTFEAKVIRINDEVDAETQQIKVYASVDDPDARSGIYLDGKVEAAQYENAVRIPLSALVEDNEIYLVKDSVAQLVQVKILHKDAETAIVEGISGKQELVTDAHNQGFAGSKVSIVDVKKAEK